MKLSEFDFALPSRLIAQRPVAPRDSTRLLNVGEVLGDRSVGELPMLLRPGDALVFNDTRVLPARLWGRRGEARIEVTLHRHAGGGLWRAFVRPSRRLKPGDRIVFAPAFAAAVVAKHAGGEITLEFGIEGEPLLAALERHGAMPLPPYIKRPAGGDERDRGDYQTLFARVPGAVAAPTAGLHFTPALVAALDGRGMTRISVTLHVGAGTFLPVRSENVEDHRMRTEFGEVTAAAAEAVNRTRARGARVVAVGSTSLRLLETAADATGRVRPFRGEVDLFIVPGFRFRVVDLLLTNFHLPRSTLFMLVSAFAGTERMKSAYAHAIAAGYRFYSYGDCCLLRRERAS